MSGIRRINFYAGPGCGKSTLAARVFGELKVRGHDVEHISEYIKVWAHEGRIPISYDQLYVFAKQLRSEDVILRNVSAVVTDSPLIMSTAYSRFYNVKCTPYLVSIAQQFDEDFPALNFFIDRTVDYVDAGRYQNETEAHAFDEFLLNHIEEHLKGEVHHVKVDEIDRIISLIEEKGLGAPQCPQDLSRLSKLKLWFKNLLPKPC